MSKFRLAAVAVFLLLAAMFVWWFVEAGRLEDRAAETAERLRQQGWRASFTELRTAGAPARLDLTFEGPGFGAAPWFWDGPALTARSLIYRQDFLSLTAPGRHRLETPFGAVACDVDRAEASLVFGADGFREAALARFSGVLDDLSCAAPGAGAAPPRATIDGIAAYLRPPVQTMVGARRMFLRIEDVKIPGAPAFDVEIDGRAVFDRSLARDAEGAPEIVILSLQPGATFEWRGAVPGRLRLAGELARDTGADPVRGWRGKLAFESDQARGAIQALAALGLVTGEAAEALRSRVSSTGRLAGVLDVRGRRLQVLDLGPEPITLTP